MQQALQIKPLNIKIQIKRLCLVTVFTEKSHQLQFWVRVVGHELCVRVVGYELSWSRAARKSFLIGFTTHSPTHRSSPPESYSQYRRDDHGSYHG